MKSEKGFKRDTNGWSMKKLFILLLLLLSIALMGETYYVSINGDDEDAGTNQMPFRTIQHAISTAVDNDVIAEIFIEYGEYNENISIVSDNSDLTSLVITGVINDQNQDYPMINGSNIGDVIYVNFTNLSLTLNNLVILNSGNVSNLLYPNDPNSVSINDSGINLVCSLNTIINNISFSNCLTSLCVRNSSLTIQDCDFQNAKLPQHPDYANYYILLYPYTANYVSTPITIGNCNFLESNNILNTILRSVRVGFNVNNCLFEGNTTPLKLTNIGSLCSDYYANISDSIFNIASPFHVFRLYNSAVTFVNNVINVPVYGSGASSSIFFIHQYDIAARGWNNLLLQNNRFILNRHLLNLHQVPSSYEFNIEMKNNTLDGSNYAIFYESSNNLYDLLNTNINSFSNNIFAGNMSLTIDHLGYIETLDIGYNCFPENFDTSPYSNDFLNDFVERNIFCDPVFNDTDNNDYTLFFENGSNHSPCIDAGDPNSDFDPDGTFADMGFSYHHHDGYSHLFDDGIHWVSFPVLNEQEYYTGFSDYYEQAYTENSSAGIFQDYATNALTIDGFTRIDGKRINQQLMDIQFDNANFDDNEFNNMLFRHEGYQITIEDSNQETPFTTYGNLYDNVPLPSQLDMDTGEYHWLGYWLLESKNIVDAFGDFWEEVEKIKSQDWYYDRQSIVRDIGGAIKPSQETEGKVMEYGKTYMIWFKGDPFVTPPITGFKWDDNSESTVPLMRSIPEKFEFTEKTNYEAIDLLNIPSNVKEIGVFENGICLGAVVVQDSSEQVLVYSDAVNRNAGNFTFELFTGARFTEKIKKYKVLNFRSGEFEAKPLTAGRNEYSVIRFNSDYDDNSEEIILKTEVFNNYPNPFNPSGAGRSPSTTISFNLGTEQKIELDIYNSKGQKVKRLYSGNIEKGNHSMVWNGTDSNNKTVSSGVYFYKLKTQQETFNRKILLMK
jgi:hypothetical protein